MSSCRPRSEASNMSKEKRLTIKLKGEHVSLKSFSNAISNSGFLLEELDRNTTGEKTTEWDIADLIYGSAEIQIMPRIVKNQTHDCTGVILGRFREGLQGLSSGLGKPDSFTDKAWDYAKKITSALSDGVERMIFIVPDDADHLEPIEITQCVVDDIEIEEVESAQKHSYGAVEGIVEVLNGFQESFYLLDRATKKRRIKCYCDKAKLAELAEKHWDKAIIVTGEISEDRNGNPHSVRMEKFRPIARGALPQVEDILGLYVVGNNG